MKPKVILSIIILTFLVVTKMSAQVSLYKSNNYTGEKLEISSSWEASSNKAWNDNINSIKIPKGYRVTIYEHYAGIEGMSLELTSDWVADSKWKNKISNIKLIAPIQLFTSKNFTGNQLYITTNWSAASNMAWNDKINSIKVPKGYKIIIYENGPTNGKSLELTSDWVADGDWTNKISNINVVASPK